jgi:hypothetical protein
MLGLYIDLEKLGLAPRIELESMLMKILSWRSNEHKARSVRA